MNELERLLPGFTAELAKIYADNARSGVIPAGRRANVVVEVNRVRAKYNQKLASLQAAGHVTDAVERQFSRVEKDYAKQLPHAA
jgi:hypothetical protein